jgi:glutathione S-transferase
MAERGLNALDDHLGGKIFICNDTRPMLADILLFGFLFTMSASGPWMNNPGRKNVAAWFERMKARPACAAAMSAFTGLVTI